MKLALFVSQFKNKHIPIYIFHFCIDSCFLKIFVIKLISILNYIYITKNYKINKFEK